LVVVVTRLLEKDEDDIIQATFVVEFWYFGVKLHSFKVELEQVVHKLPICVASFGFVGG